MLEVFFLTLCNRGVPRSVLSSIVTLEKALNDFLIKGTLDTEALKWTRDSIEIKGMINQCRERLKETF